MKYCLIFLIFLSSFSQATPYIFELSQRDGKNIIKHGEQELDPKSLDRLIGNAAEQFHMPDTLQEYPIIFVSDKRCVAEIPALLEKFELRGVWGITIQFKPQKIQHKENKETDSNGTKIRAKMDKRAQ